MLGLFTVSSMEHLKTTFIGIIIIIIIINMIIYKSEIDNVC